MTAAIVVNDRMMQPAAKGKPGVWQNRSAEELRNLTALAQAAVGFDSSRGDMLTVEDLAFDENRAAPAGSPVSQAVSVAENSPLLVKYAALLLGMLVVMAFGVRPAVRRVGSGLAAARIPAKLEAGAAAALAPPQPPVPDAERVKAQQILDEVAQHMKREPAQSSRLLQSWIHSD
jgi:flagellar M-ring protein FliF